MVAIIVDGKELVTCIERSAKMCGNGLVNLEKWQ